MTVGAPCAQSCGRCGFAGSCKHLAGDQQRARSAPNAPREGSEAASATDGDRLREGVRPERTVGYGRALSSGVSRRLRPVAFPAPYARRRQIGLSLGKHHRWNSASGPASTSTSGSSRRSLLVSSATRAWTRLASSGSTGSAHPSQTLTFDTPVMVGRFPAVSGRDEMARPGGVAPRRRGGSYPHLDDTDAAPCNGRTNISEQRLVD